MEYRKLGMTDVDISVMTLGAWAYGRDAWLNVEDEESVGTILAALDAGINVIDTAMGYGQGYSEEIVGKAVKGRRDEVILCSKCWADPKHIPSQIDGCLKRMQIDYIDLYQVHYPGPSIPICDTIGAMAQLKEAGKLRFIGVSNFNVEQMKEAVATARIDTCQPPFNVFWREVDDTVLPFCVENQIAVLAYSPLAQGLLAGRFRSHEDVPDDIRARNKLLAKDILEKALPVVDRLEEFAKRHGKSLVQAAISWTVYFPGVTSAIVGARRPSQLEENVGGVGWRLTQEEHDEISNLGLEVSALLDYSSNMWGWKPS